MRPATIFSAFSARFGAAALIAALAPAPSALAGDGAADPCLEARDTFVWHTCDDRRSLRPEPGVPGQPPAAGPQPPPGAPAPAVTGFNVDPARKDFFIPPAQRDMDGGGQGGR